MIIFPYKMGSRSAKRLKEAINVSEGTKTCWVIQRKPRASRALIVNWGSAAIPYQGPGYTVINKPVDVEAMSDKVKFFERTNNDVNVLLWTRDREIALGWGEAGHKVFARTLTRGSGGRGIHVWTGGSEVPLPMAPLYTKHQPKTHEYRVHLVRSLAGSDFQPHLVQRKVWKNVGEQPTTWDVRSHDNGFIFQSYPDLDKVPPAVVAAAKKIMEKYFSGMHFAALDVLYHKPSDKAVVCEGNTAPGVENNTVDLYAHYLRGLNEEYIKQR